MRQLELQFDIATLKHLGGQMYGGGLVKPVAELIANAWDADATLVTIQLPSGQDHDVVVADNGHGMSFNTCAELYLTIGADRRKVLESDSTRSGRRKVMGRKGLGKLSVIQATGTVEVETVADIAAIGEPPQLWLTAFRIPYGTFLEGDPDAGGQARPVEMLADGPPPNDLEFPGGSQTGTRTILRNVRIERLPNTEQFVQSMHVRFALAAETDDFSIVVDDTRVPTVEEALEAAAFEYRWAGEEVIDQVGPVQWWIGFTPDPQPREEWQGVGVYARKRLAVERPFFFNLTKGFTGQLSKEYMTGAVYADSVDDTADLISTDRGNINWSHPIGEALEAWGQRLVRTHAALWEEERGKRKLEDIAPDPELMALIEKLSERPRQECLTLMRSLARVPHVTKADLDRTARVLLNGHKHQEFLDALSEINASSVDGLPEILARWNVLEALLYLPVVRSRIEVIAKLRRLVEESAREFPDIFDHLRETPELLRPEWEPLAWNEWMATIVARVFEETLEDDKQLRPDVLCLSDSRNFVVVELKRPGHRVSVSEATRMIKYMRLIKDQLDHNTALHGARLEGLLICDELDEDAEYMLGEMESVNVKDWRQFLADSERAHSYILERLSTRVPSDDPRAAPYLSMTSMGV